MFIIGAHGADANGNSVLLNNSAKWEGGIHGINTDALMNNPVIDGPTIGGTRSSSRTTSCSSRSPRSPLSRSAHRVTRTSTRSPTRPPATPADRPNGHVLRVVGVVPTLSGLVTTPTTLSGKPSQISRLRHPQREPTARGLNATLPRADDRQRGNVVGPARAREKPRFRDFYRGAEIRTRDL
jgi:hypothetical protein